MEWTDEMVEVFTQIYSSNYSAGCVQKFEKKYNEDSSSEVFDANHAYMDLSSSKY